METFLRLVGYLSIPVLLIALRTVLRAFRHRYRLDVRTIVVPAVVGVFTLLVYLTLLSAGASFSQGLISLLVGIGAGAIMSRTMPLAVAGDEIVGIRPQWPLIAWGSALALTQLLALAFPLSADLGVVLLYLATGYLVGESGGLLFRRRELVDGRSATAGGLVAGAATLLLLVVLPVPGSSAQDEVHTLAKVFAGEVDGVSVEIAGTGRYYGTAIDLWFWNTTGSEQQVHIPIGTRLVPKDRPGVQTMVTAGDEVLIVPVDRSVMGVRAFCGEADDDIPAVDDFFELGGRVGGDLGRTLERIKEEGAYDNNGQAAVWSHTDNADLSENDRARQLAVGHGSSPGGAGSAGLVAAAAAVAGAREANRRKERDTLILSGNEALTWLSGQKSDWPKADDIISVEEEGTTRTYLRPPSGIPDRSLGLAFETRLVKPHGDLIPEENLTIVRERHRPSGAPQWDQWDPANSTDPVDDVLDLFRRYDIPCQSQDLSGERFVVVPENLSDRADAMAFETTTKDGVEVIDLEKPVTVIGVPHPPAKPPPTPVKPPPVKPTPDQAPPMPVQPPVKPTSDQAPPMPVQPPVKPTSDQAPPTPVQPPPVGAGPPPSTTSVGAPLGTEALPDFDTQRFANTAAIGIAGLSPEGRKTLTDIVHLLARRDLKLPDLSDRIAVRDFVKEKLAEADTPALEKVRANVATVYHKLWVVSSVRIARDLADRLLGTGFTQGQVEEVVGALKGTDVPPEQAESVARGILSLGDTDYEFLKKQIDSLRKAAGVPDQPPSGK